MGFFTAAAIVSTVLSAGSQYAQGQEIREESEDQAAQIRANARRRLEQGQMLAQERRRQLDVDLSNIRAAQAASGATTQGPQSLQQLGRAAGESRYDELAYLYEAQLDAEGMRRQARATKERGQARSRAMTRGAVATAIQGGNRAYQTYRAGQSSGMFEPQTGRAGRFTTYPGLAS